MILKLGTLSGSIEITISEILCTMSGHVEITISFPSLRVKWISFTYRYQNWRNWWSICSTPTTQLIYNPKDREPCISVQSVKRKKKLHLKWWINCSICHKKEKCSIKNKYKISGNKSFFYVLINTKILNFTCNTKYYIYKPNAIETIKSHFYSFINKSSYKTIRTSI